MSLFRRKKPKVKPEVKIGQVWTVEYDDPFAENGRVVITAIKKDYVQYEMKYGSISSLDIECFTKIYKLKN